MANRLYASARQAFADAGVAWGADTINIIMVTAGYAPNTAHGGDQYLSTIGSGAIVGPATGVTLTGKTNVDGKVSASNTTFTAVSGAQVTALVVFKYTGVAATSQLIGVVDTATNLPFTPNGGDVVWAWDSTNGIFTL